MDERLFVAMAKARGLLFDLTPELVEKTMWGSPAGKARLAKRLVTMLPAHRVYTEPFAGSAAVFFAKDPVPVEALNDADPEIAEAFATLKRLTPADVAKLRAMEWRSSAETWRRLKEASPPTDIAKVHRFLYLSHFSYGYLRGKSFNARRSGTESTGPERVEKFAPRLKNVHVSAGDYEPVVRKYDAKDAVHFLDPPYTGYNAAVGESDFDEERFFRLLKDVKGRFLVTYGIRGRLPKLLKAEGFPVKRVRTPRTLRTMRGVGGSKYLTQIIATNYEVAKKRFDELELDGWELDDARDEDTLRTTASVPAALSPPVEPGEALDSGDPEEALDDEVESTSTEEAGFTKEIPLLKGVDPEDERFVLGIVLEPETVDAQNDIYSAAEIRSAAHRFMTDFQEIGLMHVSRVNDAVKIVESYLAPSDLTIGDRPVKKGTWLLGVRIVSDALWTDVREGRLAGFSVGGSSRRVPEAEAAA